MDSSSTRFTDVPCISYSKSDTALKPLKIAFAFFLLHNQLTGLAMFQLLCSECLLSLLSEAHTVLPH